MKNEQWVEVLVFFPMQRGSHSSILIELLKILIALHSWKPSRRRTYQIINPGYTVVTIDPYNISYNWALCEFLLAEVTNNLLPICLSMKLHFSHLERFWEEIYKLCASFLTMKSLQLPSNVQALKSYTPQIVFSINTPNHEQLSTVMLGIPWYNLKFLSTNCKHQEASR